MPNLRHIAIAACMAALQPNAFAQALTVQCNVKASPMSPAVQVSVQRDPWTATENGKTHPIREPRTMAIRPSAQRPALQTQNEGEQYLSLSQQSSAVTQMMNPPLSRADYLYGGDEEPRMRAVRRMTIYDLTPGKFGQGYLMEAYGAGGEFLWRGVTLGLGVVALCASP